MDKYLDFKVNTIKFPEIKTLADNLHSKNQRLVVILDPAIQIDVENDYYAKGVNDDIFIKSGKYNSETFNNNLISKIRTKKVVFIDWFSDKCMNTWGEGLEDLYK